MSWQVVESQNIVNTKICRVGQIYKGSLSQQITLLNESKKVQVGKDQEKAQSEKRFPLQKPRWVKTKLTIRYLYHVNISYAE